MLIIEGNGALLLDGTPVSLPMEQMREFLLANTSEPCMLNNATVGDIMNLCYHVQDFIQDYFLEEYHVVNALACTLRPERRIERVEFLKEMVVDGDNYVTMVPRINIVVGDEGAELLKDAPVLLVEQMIISDHSGQMSGMKLFSGFNLLEVIDCAFSELGHILASTPEDSVHIWSR